MPIAPSAVVSTSTVTLNATFTDGTGALVNPTSPTVTLSDSYRTVLVNAATPTNLSTGVYQYVYTLSNAAALGTWTAHWTGVISGTATVADGTFTVVASGNVGITPWVNASSFIGASAITTLGALANPGDVTITTPGSIAVNAVIQIDTLAASEWRTVNSISGSGPYTVTLDRPLSLGHSGSTTSIYLADRRLGGVDLPAGLTLDNCCQQATEWLWAASGRQFTLRSDTVRPSQLGAGCDHNWGWWRRLDMMAGDWWWAGGWSNSTAEYVTPEPILGTPTITVEGAPFTAFVVYDGRRIVRNDGQTWPCCQLLSTPDGGKGTWSITYIHGRPPPMSGVIACRELTAEFALAASGVPGNLHARTDLISHDGTSASLADPLYLHAGLLGLPLIDTFILSTNPHGLIAPSSVRSADSIVGAVR